MTNKEAQEIRDAINVAKQFSEDNPTGRYEALLIAVIPMLDAEIKHIEAFQHIGMRDSKYSVSGRVLKIARAINQANQPKQQKQIDHINDDFAHS